MEISIECMEFANGFRYIVRSVIWLLMLCFFFILISPWCFWVFHIRHGEGSSYSYTLKSPYQASLISLSGVPFPVGLLPLYVYLFLYFYYILQPSLRLFHSRSQFQHIQFIFLYLFPSISFSFFPFYLAFKRSNWSL